MERGKGLPKKFKIVIYIAFFPLIIFQGCVTKEAVKNAAHEIVLKERVETYWGHKINQAFEKSYEFETPFYRKSVSLVNYIKGFNTEIMQWKEVKIDDIKIEGDSAEVDLKLKVKVKLPEVRTFEDNSLIKEKWVKVDGIWYHVPAKLK